MRERQRRSIRLREYEYSWPGAYFVTVCVQHRLCLFGDVEDGAMHLSTAGEAVKSWWDRLPSKFPAVACDAAIVMPNHVHGVLLLSRERECADNPAPLGEVVQWFKTITTNAYLRGVKDNGWTPFDGRLWQRNYYEHIVRDNRDLDRIRAYIEANPSRWSTDAENQNTHHS